jgi:manganese/zinc/iron transport system permease protein
MNNPYWGQNFFGFFKTLLLRLTGSLPLNELPSDEVQLLALIGISFACALIGVFLNLKKMTMLANSISHTVLLGIVVAYVITFSLSSEFSVDIKTLLLASLVTAFLTTSLTQLLTQFVKLQEDASIGLVFTTLFALGVVLVTVFTRNLHIGIEAVMGNIDALDPHDLKLISLVVGLDLIVVLSCFKEFKVTAFDPALASSLGISPSLFAHLLMLLTAATCIGAFRAVGVLLVLAFLVAPVLMARLCTNHLKTLIVLACGLGILCSTLGVALSRHFLSSYHLPLSTAGLVVTLMGLAYLVILTFRPRIRFNQEQS